ncbi:GNAT family N-acetyltransferase [Streptomyces lonarensis]|uniref:N-acetyltransferase n=1 Tax=Streptomyces lonarensis TaxID=700599 RepID=A0A7X6HYT2_9ACTN|nr:N-acetyltransferase [Streptomyces lonarensis]NJQ05760.1 N-acetyltransferase [Streptomyces lonarensis]
MLIRREIPSDIPSVQHVTTAAFTSPENPEPVETTLLARLRDDRGWIPELSLVAVTDGGQVSGHVVCTRGTVDGAPAVGLGPLSVHPAHQRRGIGQALVHAVLGAAEARGEPLVALLGSPRYYGRFGFRAATEYRIDPPEPAWGDYFQVRPLAAWTPRLRGGFRYAAPFDRI